MTTTDTTTAAPADAEEFVDRFYGGLVHQLQGASNELRDLVAVAMNRDPFDTAAASDLLSAATALFDVMDVASQLQGRRYTEDHYRAAFPVAQQLTSQERPEGAPAAAPLAGLGEEDLREVTGALRGLWERYEQDSPVGRYLFLLAGAAANEAASRRGAETVEAQP